MSKEKFSTERKSLMRLMNDSDEFFKEFGILDDKVLSNGAISIKHKELCMVAISIVTKCEECLIYHIDQSFQHGADKNELIEIIKLGMMAGGSTSYPYVRKAFAELKEIKLI